MNKHPIVTLHGLFGWAQGEVPVDYWGGVFNSSSVPAHQCAVGPISSWHDRACEAIAQIKGLRVDYGAAHAKKYGHARYGRDYRGNGFYPEWDDGHPVHLVGHSAGGNTMRMIQHLLATDHYKLGSNEDWVKSISAISSVLNGTPVPYILGCDRETGAARRGTLGWLIQLAALEIAKYAKISSYDFELDHWGLKQTNCLEDDFAMLGELALFDGNDNLPYDLTFHGGYEANGYLKSYPNTYYFGYATQQTWKIGKYHYPTIWMSKLLTLTSFLAGRFDIEKQPPFPGWGKGQLTNDQWYANDGLVPVMSQLYPFINDAVMHPVASTPGISNRREFSPGVWYYENTTDSTGRSFDHFDIVCGAFLQQNLIEVQKKFYADLWKRLGSL